MSGFLYPRLVSIQRKVETDQPGAQPGYSGVTPDQFAIIKNNLRAHIEAERQGTSPEAKLPADAAGQSIWSISFPKMKLGLVKSRDVIEDELGQRYYVISADWSPLCTVCRSQILEN